jgi:hypothetical protein
VSGFPLPFLIASRGNGIYVDLVSRGWQAWLNFVKLQQIDYELSFVCACGLPVRLLMDGTFVGCQASKVRTSTQSGASGVWSGSGVGFWD